jgi:hypothetical protein
MFTVMGSKSEQLLARVINAMRQSRQENDEFGSVTPDTAQHLSDVLNDAEDYLRENEMFVDRMARRGDMS